MLPLVGQRLSQLVPGQGTALTAASAIAAQAVMVPIALLAGARAGIASTATMLARAMPPISQNTTPGP